jgi:hypothetical protein
MEQWWNGADSGKLKKWVKKPVTVSIRLPDANPDPGIRKR